MMLAEIATYCIFAVMSPQGEIIVCVKPNATVEYRGPVDVAAKAFWDEVAKHLPPDLQCSVGLGPS